MTANPAIYSFPAIADPQSRVLILGSMPGVASLQAGQYYAHPRNQFWQLIAALFADAPLTDYAQKQQLLLDNNIALWDVMHSCQRHGSLDSKIDKHSIIPNDFNHFFNTHPFAQHVFFNGATAETAFRKRVLSTLESKPLTLHRLPSSSPAHAHLTLQQKLIQWQCIARTLL